MPRLIILDRDGVINEDSDDFIKTVDEWIPLPGSIDAISRLSRSGFDVVVATNQSGVGRGLFDHATLDAMHNKMAGLVHSAGGDIKGVFFCPHTPDDHCDCRKPLPGLLQQIENAGHGKIDQAIMVGDSLRDLEAGLAAGCKQLCLVKTGKGIRTLEKMRETRNDLLDHTQVFDNLAELTDFLLS